MGATLPQPDTNNNTPETADNPEIVEQRKAEHIRINLEEDVSFKALTTHLEQYFFLHQALPELDLSQVDTSITLFGKQLQTPLLISSMTGGTARARAINRTLAAGAQAAGMAMGLGSQRAAIEDASLANTYDVRDVAPTVPASLASVVRRALARQLEDRLPDGRALADALVATGLLDGYRPGGRALTPRDHALDSDPNAETREAIPSAETREAIPSATLGETRS